MALPSLSFIRCPFCDNDNIIIYVDFNKKTFYAKCIKRKHKSILRRKTKFYYTGCGKKFKLTSKKKNGRRNRYIFKK